MNRQIDLPREEFRKKVYSSQGKINSYFVFYIPVVTSELPVSNH